MGLMMASRPPVHGAAEAATPARRNGAPPSCAFNESHWRAVEDTIDALGRDRSISLVLGAAGAGLDAVARESAGALNPPFHGVVVSPRGGAGDDLVRQVAAAIGAERDGPGASAMLRARLEEIAERDVMAAVFVTEADDLTDDALATIERLAAHGRRLSRMRGLEINGDAPPLGARFVLLGSSSIAARLAASQDGAMRLAVEDAPRLRSFGPDETRAFLRRRLRCDDSAPLLEPAAVARVTALTQGRPELLGALCGAEAFERAERERMVVNASLIDRIAEALDLRGRRDALAAQERRTDLAEATLDADWAASAPHWTEETGEAAAEEIAAGGPSASARLRELAGNSIAALRRAADHQRLLHAADPLLQAAAPLLAKAVTLHRYLRALRDQLAWRARAAFTRRLPAPGMSAEILRTRATVRGAKREKLVKAAWALGSMGLMLAFVSVVVVSVESPLTHAPRQAVEAVPVRPAPAPARPDPGFAPSPPGYVDWAMEQALTVADGAAQLVSGESSRSVATERLALRRGRALAGVEALPRQEGAAEIERRLTLALREADQRFARLQYTEPRGRSAYDALLHAWYLAPSDPRVTARFDDLLEHYRAEADVALTRGNDRDKYTKYNKINELLEKILGREPL